MKMNRNHTDFNIDMEMLASIPRSPNNANLGDICKDLDLLNHGLALEIIDRLKSDGFDLIVNTKQKRMVKVTSKGWPEAKAAALVYWNKVYG